MRVLRTIFAALLALGAVPAAAVDSYEGCLALAASDPVTAEREASSWALAGGGAAAGHCRALALAAMGAERRAAALMAEIATLDRTLPDRVRAELLVEAGGLYLGLGDVAAGTAAAARALLLAPGARPALALSARLKAEDGDWQGAVADFDKALAGAEPDAELLALRAAAKLRLGDRVGAQSDLIWAAEIAPGSAAVWLERGTLEAANGNHDAARGAWLRAIELDRDGPVAEAARLRLQTMEAN